MGRAKKTGREREGEMQRDRERERQQENNAHIYSNACTAFTSVPSHESAGGHKKGAIHIREGLVMFETCNCARDNVFGFWAVKLEDRR